METRTVFSLSVKPKRRIIRSRKFTRSHTPADTACQEVEPWSMEHWSLGHITNRRIHPYQVTKFAFFHLLIASQRNRFACAGNEVAGTSEECWRNFVVKC